METVGIRDLKAHLSRYLRRVQSGARLVVTERGRPVAAVGPIKTAAEVGWAHQMVAEGRARWDGGKPAGGSPPVPVAAGRTVAAAVLEDRR